MIELTICNPIFNGEVYLNKQFESIFSQKVNFEYKLLYTDSGSTDKSVEIIKKWQKTKGNIELIQIDNKDYGHGKTRNFLANRVDTKFTLFIVQDCLPKTDDWLQKMYDSLELEDKMITVFSRHQAWKSSHPVKKRYIKKTFDDYVKNIKGLKSYKEKNYTHYFTNLSDVTDWDKVTALSNVAAIYRTKELQEIGFKDLYFAEDKDFMKRAIQDGYYIGFQDDAIVYHSHDYNLLGTFQRTFDEWQGIKKQGNFPFKFKVYHIFSQSIINYFRDIEFCILSNELSLFERILGILSSLPVELCIKLGMYYGLNYEKYSESFINKISYQKNWRERESK